MPLIERPEPGSFCMVELASLDQDRAKRFYEPLFGWSHQDLPTGPDGVYTLFRIDGRVAASAYAMRPQERERVPPHWQLYVAVENADETGKRAAALGATLIEAPFDVFDYGRMAVLQDPTGAYFSLWQPAKTGGIEIAGVPGALCWADLNTREPERAKQFYEELFGWKITAGRDGDYLHIRNGDDFIGGIPPAGFSNPYVPPHWLAYYQVEDVNASAQNIAALGGKLHFGPESMENVGRFAVASDAEGAAFAIFKPAES